MTIKIFQVGAKTVLNVHRGVGSKQKMVSGNGMTHPEQFGLQIFTVNGSPGKKFLLEACHLKAST